jgi:hypothetical protein
MATPNLNLILERWQASLNNKKKDREHIQSNFDELFEQLRTASATLGEAKELLKDAIKAHLPPTSTAKFTWNSVKNLPKYSGVTRDEFIEGWHKDIIDKATNSMYLFFPIPTSEEEDEPKVRGKMSSREYALQRAHADSFEMLEVQELQSGSDFLLEEEMLDALDKSGNKDE